MRQVARRVWLFTVGCVNQGVFSISRGRVMLYRFHGTSGVSLTVAGATAIVSCLPDGDDYVVLDAGHRLVATLAAATTATIEVAGQQVPVDVTVLAGRTGQTVLLKRLLKHVSLYERDQVSRGRLVPVARLRPHYKPAAGDPVAVSRART
ncbi:MAG: hypothetical protein JO016_11985 [Actinobacteria bacterium]|nr:hypothetical protein [Actinomycetota bacterium]